MRVVLGNDGGLVTLRVENEGQPLPEALRGSTFESMQSLRSAPSAGVPHLGLGLYIARLIAEFHGGTLRADSLSGKAGAVFEAGLTRAS